ncbi:MAG TPA: spore coat protein U domain-containing protein [Ramlibacter sp.]
MRSCWMRLLLALALLAALPAARAAITCTIAAPGASINYVNGTTATVQTFFTVSCTRTSASDPTSVSYDVLADNGLNANGQNNNAALGTARLRYDVFTTASCGTTWKGNRSISDTISWTGGATGTITKQTNFWVCIVGAQTATTAGTYTDTVRMAMTYGGNNGPTVYGNIPVSIYAPALCTMVTPAGNLNLSYAAFGPQVSQSTSFAVTCTSGMPYTIATDVTEAVVTGLRYTLSLSATASSGTGAPQTHGITATIPAGQAGTCPTAVCVGSRTHTLTITY